MPGKVKESFRATCRSTGCLIDDHALRGPGEAAVKRFGVEKVAWGWVTTPEVFSMSFMVALSCFQ